MNGKLVVSATDMGDKTHLQASVKLSEVNNLDKVNVVFTVGKALHMHDGFEKSASSSEYAADKMALGLATICLITGMSYAELSKMASTDSIIKLGVTTVELVRDIINDKKAPSNVMQAFYGE